MERGTRGWDIDPMRSLSIGARALIVLVAILTISACGSSSKPTAGGGDGATFTYVTLRSIITNWDPALSANNEQIVFYRNVYETLTYYDAQRKQIVPSLATSWRSSADRRRWEFTLRKGVLFHTGNRMTSASVKAALSRTQQLGGGVSYMLGPIASMTTPSPTKIVFALKEPANLPLILSSNAAAYVYDTKVPGQTVASLRGWFPKGHDAGTGPYTVDSYSPGQAVQVTLRQFPRYWGGWQGDHYTHVAFRFSNDLNTSWQLVKTGAATFVDSLNPQLFQQAESTTGLQTTSGPSAENVIAFYNTAGGPMTNIALRRAISHAIDYSGTIATLRGSAVPLGAIVPAGLTPGHVDRPVPPQDLEAAKRELASAGYGPGGKPLNLRMLYQQGDTIEQAIADLLAPTLSSLNIDLRAQGLSYDGFQTIATAKDPNQRQDIFLERFYGYNASAEAWFSSLFHSANPPFLNYSYLDDRAVDAKIDELPLLEATDPAAAQRQYAALQRTLLDELVVAAPIAAQVYQRVFQAGIEGYVDNPVYQGTVFVHDLKPPTG